jgi:cephalosporin-C deacetylase
MDALVPDATDGETPCDWAVTLAAMMFDMPLDQLREYRPAVAEPYDFESFWADQIDEVQSLPLAATFTLVDTVIRSAEVYDVSFAGHNGSRISGWLLVPHDLDAETPVVVEFVGYGGGRGVPADWLTWSCAGFAHFVMDTRGQGGSWRRSDTADAGDLGEPSAKGFMTRGIANPADHYFTRLFIDAFRALQVPAAFEGLADRGVVSAGVSQGGGLALAAAHLGSSVVAVVPEVPFLAHIRRGAEVTDANPYAEIADYCKVYPERVDSVFDTLSYIDVVNHARRALSPALFSVGLTDLITPPSTVFAAYNHYAGRKHIEVYTFNGHEGGGTLHFERKVQFVRQVVADAAAQSEVVDGTA